MLKCSSAERRAESQAKPAPCLKGLGLELRAIADGSCQASREGTPSTQQISHCKPQPLVALNTEVWGREIVLCHVGANRYEAPAPLAEGWGDAEAEPKRIKVERQKRGYSHISLPFRGESYID